MLSAFGRFNERGVGGAVRFRTIQRAGGGGGCYPLSADSISEVSALSADPVIQSVGGGC